ncbi:MAG: BatD family protein [Gemmataceae bacterium]
MDRAREHFYDAVAAGEVRVSWSADPTAVPQGGDVTLTLIVRGAANPAELRKPDLRKLPKYGERFQVIDRTDPPPKSDAAEVRFTYTLRPRQTSPVEVPALRYAYYRPGLPEGRRFQTAYADPLTLTVTAPPSAAAPPPVPLDGPEKFFHLATDRGKPVVPRWAWAVPPLLVPVTVGGWVLGWRWLFPDAARRAKLRRTRAVRIALDRLKRAGTAPDPAAEAAATVHGYLAGRFSLPPAAQTPTEIAVALREAGQPESLAEAAAGFLTACDTARFAPAGDGGLPLVEQAERFVTAMEGQAA